jgi:hypothetical protein
MKMAQYKVIKGSVYNKWNVDCNAGARTISCCFPGANDTLLRLNDTWKIFNNTFTLVEANPTNTTKNSLP